MIIAYRLQDFRYFHLFHQLYSQAKRLQALPVLKRRARSVEPALDHRFSERFGLHVGEHAAAHAGHYEPRETSLCTLCRGYWRSFRKLILTYLIILALCINMEQRGPSTWWSTPEAVYEQYMPSCTGHTWRRPMSSIECLSIDMMKSTAILLLLLHRFMML